jgi:hypothetical protein
MRGDLNDLCLRHIAGRPGADGKPNPTPSVDIVAMRDNLHAKDGSEPGGSGCARLHVVLIVAPL